MNPKQLQEIDSALAELDAAAKARNTAYQNVDNYQEWNEAADAVHAIVWKLIATFKQYGYKGKVTQTNSYFIHPEYIEHYKSGLYKDGVWNSNLGTVPPWALYTINY